MQSFSTPARPRLLVVELWGVGDLALALPFLRAAGRHADVTVLAKPQAAPVLRRFCPEAVHVPLDAPWTEFRGKYRLTSWPWRTLRTTLAALRSSRFDAGVSVRPDPRDHALLALAGVRHRAGYGRLGSSLFLTADLPPPASIHRGARWAELARHFGWTVAPAAPSPKTGRRIVIDTGARLPTRRWPAERYQEIARRLTATGWDVDLRDDRSGSLDDLMDALSAADRFLGNDSGPGHLAAALGVPTFTLFGSCRPEEFSPAHPQAGWLPGRPCPHFPCRDYCRYDRPHCLHDQDVETVWRALSAWLKPA